jgi:hypothetical protein
LTFIGGTKVPNARMETAAGINSELSTPREGIQQFMLGFTTTKKVTFNYFPLVFGILTFFSEMHLGNVFKVQT